MKVTIINPIVEQAPITKRDLATAKLMARKESLLYQLIELSNKKSSYASRVKQDNLIYKMDNIDYLIHMVRHHGLTPEIKISIKHALGEKITWSNLS